MLCFYLQHVSSLCVSRASCGCLTPSLQRASFDCLTAASHGGVVCLIIFCLTRCCLSLSGFPVFHVALDGGRGIASLFCDLIAGQAVIRVLKTEQHTSGLPSHLNPACPLFLSKKKHRFIDPFDPATAD